MVFLPRSLRQFGLRTLLLFCLIAAIGAGLWRWHMDWVHAQDKIAERLSETGIQISRTSWGPQFVHDWFGSRYFSNITGIRGNGRNVRDEQMELMAQIPTLEEIYIPSSRISDEGFAYLDQLPRVRKLAIWRTRITNEGFRHVSQLPQLEVVDIQGTSVDKKGLAMLRQHPRLHTLRFRFSVDDEGIEILADIPNLRLEYLTGRKLTEKSFELLRDRIDVQQLTLEKTVATNWADYLIGHPTLKVLGAIQSPMTDQQCQRLLQADQLESLRLEMVPIGDAAIEGLADARKLQQVHLFFTQITAAGFIEAIQDEVDWINIQGVQIMARHSRRSPYMFEFRGPIAVEHLGKLGQCKQLEFLSVSAPLADTKMRFEFLGAIENLISLRMRGIQQEVPIAALANLNHLQSIELNACPAIDFEGLDQLAKLEFLDSVSLTQCNLTDQQLEDLAQIKQLGLLSIDGEQLTNAGIAQLVALKNLHHLTIADGKQITDEALASVAQLRKLSELELVSLSITDEGIQHLHAMPYLSYVRLSDLSINENAVNQLRQSLPMPARIEVLPHFFPFMRRAPVLINVSQQPLVTPVAPTN
ncbi:hypothetical protein AB1L30_06130 [Bremerella sp. JC817]|uniref:hypothetical protein n=1 Tax=Bremerella sp. JC817 TaxID=3231756 RepID=UPI00345B1E67